MKNTNTKKQNLQHMTNTEARILNRLKAGLSYAQIQEELNVSSKTIAAVKKEYLPAMESNNDVLSDTSASQLSNYFPPEESRNAITENKFPNNNYTQTDRKMATEKNFPESEKVVIAKFELEEHRLDLEHEREMTRLKAEIENQQREADFREKELSLKQYAIALEKHKKDEEFRTLLFRLKRLCDECETDEYSYSEVNDMLDKAIELEDELKKYAFINNITYADSESQNLLDYIIDLLSTAVDDDDEGDTVEIKCSDSFIKLRDKHDFDYF
jgi:hypothetical protein